MLNETQSKETTQLADGDSSSFRSLVAAYRGSVLWGLLLELIGSEFNAVSAAEFQKHLNPRLDVTVAEIDEALAGLVKLGLLGRTASGYRRLRDHFLIPYEEVSKAGPPPTATKTLQVLGHLSHLEPSLNGNWTARLDRYDLYELSQLVEQKLIEIEERRKKDVSAPKADGLYEIYFGGTRMVSLAKEQG